MMKFENKYILKDKFYASLDSNARYGYCLAFYSLITDVFVRSQQLKIPLMLQNPYMLEPLADSCKQPII